MLTAHICPPSVTRGESSPSFGSAQAQHKTKIDWLNFTFKTSVFQYQETEEDFDLSPHFVPPFVDEVAGCFSDILGRSVYFEKNLNGGGMRGYRWGGKLTTRAGSKTYEIGVLAWGGVQQRGTCLVSLSGGGCSLFRDFAPLVAFLRLIEARITRVDIALDFLDGQFSIDDAVSFYQGGGFSSNGRPPSVSQAGNWIDGVARTLYVGKAANGKLCRVYEKGHQLGDFSSPWVRFEVQFGNRDRFLELEILTDPDSAFRGAYPCFSHLLDCAPRKIPIVKKTAEKTISHLLTHLKRSYGKVVSLLADKLDFDNLEFLEQIRLPGLPRRINVAEYESGFTWKDCLTTLTERSIYVH